MVDVHILVEIGPSKHMADKFEPSSDSLCCFFKYWTTVKRILFIGQSLAY